MSSNKKLLSIIIPNYNYGRYIAATLDSVIKQDYQPIELILVDDASTDNSVAVARDYLAKHQNRFTRAELLEQDSNQGKLAAINRALLDIRGDYTVILDSDDLLKPDYLTRCVETLEAVRTTQAHIGFIYTDCQLIGEDGENLDRGRSTGFDPVLLEQLSYVPEPAVTVTKALVEAAPFDETIRRGTKHHKWRRIVANGWHGLHIPEPLFCYRMHSRNLSGIGTRVLAEVEKGEMGHRILSGYWPTAAG